MMRDIDKQLQALHARRTGLDRMSDMATESAAVAIAKSMKSEAYINRAPINNKYTQYALGAMQAVDPDYTRISFEEAARVQDQLKKGLEKKSIPSEFRLQGSVACDIHIRGVSDVDLLVLDGRYIRYDPSGSKCLSGWYNPVSYDTLQALLQLRKESEIILDSAFPAATVKKDGAKAINITGGSLRRPVDVVPSNWFDTQAYQCSSAEVDRGVEILNKDVPERVSNTPFKHIQKINERDQKSLGGLKKAIRLCKNVKADAMNDGTKIALSSFDIASALWHANMTALTVGIARELVILAEATLFLDDLVRRLSYAKSLRVPDDSRYVFDSDEKIEGLRLLSLEMNDLSERVAREQSKSVWGEAPKLDELRKAYIPG